MNPENQNPQPTNIIAGRGPVLELLRSGRVPDCLYIQTGEQKGPLGRIIHLCKEQGVPVKEVTPQKLLDLTGIKHHQGVAAQLPAWEYATLEEILAKAQARGEPPFLVLCDGIQDPHNLGAIIRTAEAAGAHGVVIPKRGGAGLTPTVVKASAGAVVHLPVARVSNLVATMESLKADHGLWFYCAHMDGAPWCQTDFSGPVGLVIGSEGDGVSRLVKEHCDFVVALPMWGQVGSLNASVAAGIILYEAARQRAGLEAKNGK